MKGEYAGGRGKLNTIFKNQVRRRRRGREVYMKYEVLGT